MILSQIAAMAKNRVIGKDGDLPWSLPEDMKFFREKTKGHMIIMGRKTFESFPKPLPQRLHVVITRQKDYKAPEGVHVFHSIDEAVEFCKDKTGEWGDEVFIIGGGEIYRQSLPITDYIYLTEIDQEFEGDAQFPEFDEQFEIASREDRFEPINFSFCLYKRRHKDL